MHRYEAPKEDMALYVLHTQLELGTSLGESPALWTSAFCPALANQRAARRSAAWLAGRGFFQAARLQNDSSACKSSFCAHFEKKNKKIFLFKCAVSLVGVGSESGCMEGERRFFAKQDVKAD